MGADDDDAYAAGELSLHDMLSNEELGVVKVKLEDGAATCRVDDLSECHIIVTRKDGFGPDKIIKLGDTLDEGFGHNQSLIEPDVVDNALVEISWFYESFASLEMPMSLNGGQMPPSWSEADVELPSLPVSCESPKVLINKLREGLGGDAQVQFQSVEVDSFVSDATVRDAIIDLLRINPHS